MFFVFHFFHDDIALKIVPIVEVVTNTGVSRDHSTQCALFMGPVLKLSDHLRVVEDIPNTQVLVIVKEA